MISNPTTEELKRLLENQDAVTLLAKAKIKTAIRKADHEVSEIVSFWKQGENWIDENRMMIAAELLASMSIIKYVATEFSLIVEVKR